MTGAATATVDRRVEISSDPAADWVLRTSFTDAGRPYIDGLPTVRSGPVTVAFDGLLFDRDEWLRALDLHAHATSADIVLALALRTGADAFSDLRGQFTVVLLDERTATIRVARDPLGSHPLFFTTVQSRTYFATTPEPLLAQPGVSRDLNPAALADHLCKRWPQRDETFFRAISRVPPGWEVLVSTRGAQPRRYWNPVGDEIEWLPSEQHEQFDRVLDRAVERGLRAGRSGIFLSGGFDSVSVAAVASDLARKMPTATPAALSLGFPDPECDERLVQASVARTLGMPLHLVDFRDAVGPRGLLASALELNRGLAAPLFNTWAPAYFALVSDARRHGIDTILTGEGGDEWLGVSPFLAADLILARDVAGLVRMGRTNYRSYRQNWLQVLRSTVWRYGLRPIAGMAAHTVAPAAWDRSRARRVAGSTPSWVAPDPALRAAQFERALRNLAPARPQGGFYSRESRVFLDHPLTSWLFEEQYQFGRRLGVRYVHPYWDADLLVQVYRTPPDRLNAGGRSKGLVRQTVARRFPALGFERQRKVSALSFFASTVKSEGPALGEALADFSALGDLGVVDPAGARAFMRTSWGGSSMDLGRAWNLVNVESWVRRQVNRS
jgi:asparagine synthase (glutamine-hydrolysing)